MKFLLPLLLLLNGVAAHRHPASKATLNATLARTAAAGDTGKIVKELSQGADVNAKTPLGQTPLEEAVEYGHYDAAQLLLQHGANANAESNFGTPLVWAVERGSVSIVRLLLDNHADPNQDLYSAFPLDMVILWCCGAQEQDTNTLSVVTRVSPDTLANERVGQQSKQKLAEQMSLRNVGAEPGAVERERQQGIEIMRLLLAHGANLNRRQKDGTTALIEAAQIGSLQAIQLLLGAGASVNVQDQEGITALFAAVVGRNADAVQLLLKSGADPNRKLKDGRTALDMAKGMQNSDIAALLEQAGAR